MLLVVKRGTFSCCLTKGFTMNLLKKLLMAGFLAVGVQSAASADFFTNLQSAFSSGSECDLKKIARFAQEVKKDSTVAEKEVVVDWLRSLLRREGIIKYFNSSLWLSECLIVEGVIDSPVGLDYKVECLLEEKKKAGAAQWRYVGKAAIVVFGLTFVVPNVALKIASEMSDRRMYYYESQLNCLK
jgi:hypothetical protein